MFSFNKSSYESKMMRLLQDTFYVTARRNKILAKWAAGRLNYTGDKLLKYVRSLIFSYLIAPNDKKLIEKVAIDFRMAGVNISETRIRQKLLSIEERIRNKIRLSRVS